MTAPGLRLRPATDDDLPALVALEAASLGADAWSKPQVAAELAGVPATRWVVVAEQAATVLGYGVLLSVADTADVQRVVVDSAHRRAGIGRAVPHALVAEADRRGCQRVLLEVAADNPAAVGLYAAAGFVEVARRRGYFSAGRDAVVMRRDAAERLA